MDRPSPLPRVHLLGDGYISHQVAGLGLCRQLAALGCLTDSLAAADVVILHHELDRVRSTLAYLPALQRKYVIGQLVWETNRVPDKVLPALARLDEIWTPSLFSARTFVPLHRAVYVVPHVVDRPRPARQSAVDAQAARVAEWLADEPNALNCLAVMASGGERKNLAGLQRAVARAQCRVPSLRLVVKGVDDERKLDAPKLLRSRGTLQILGPLSDGALAALHARCPLMASAHRAEGWGLPLSDAMAMGHAVIATGYSGNLSFMQPGNAWLVRAHEVPVANAKLYHAVPAGSVWAEPWLFDLEDQLVAAAHAQLAGQRARPRQAARDVARYGPARVQACLRGRLAAIGQLLTSRRAARP